MEGQALSTYAQLQTDIASWIVGEDITAQIQTFIRLAEDRHKLGIVGPDGKRNPEQGAIRLRTMERRATLPGNGTPFLPTPPNMLEHRRLQYVGSTERDRELTYNGSENFAFNAHWKPNRYTITRNEFEFNGNVPTSSTIECLYYEPLTPLSDNNQTNDLLDLSYGAYLFGSLCEADIYTHDDRRVEVWEQKYAACVAGIMHTERRQRRSQGQLRLMMKGRSTP